MTKKIKLTKTTANGMMGYAFADGHIGAWNISANGYVRYFDAAAKVWRDLIEFDFKRWNYAL